MPTAAVWSCPPRTAAGRASGSRCPRRTPRRSAPMRPLACSRPEKPEPPDSPGGSLVKSRLGRLPSPALVIACVALFVSLGGVSYGLAKGSVDSREIKNNSVRSVDVRNNNLRSKDVRNNTLRTFDIRNNEVRGFDIRQSTIQGRDVAFNTLTGDDVSEESLGKVPTAGTADTATAAGSVNGVGLSKIVYAAEQGSGPVEI